MKKVTITYEIEDRHDEEALSAHLNGESYKLILSELMTSLRQFNNGKGWGHYYDCDDEPSDDVEKLILNIYDFVNRELDDNNLPSLLD